MDAKVGRWPCHAAKCIYACYFQWTPLSAATALISWHWRYPCGLFHHSVALQDEKLCTCKSDKVAGIVSDRVRQTSANYWRAVPLCAALIPSVAVVPEQVATLKKEGALAVLMQTSRPRNLVTQRRVDRGQAVELITNLLRRILQPQISF